MSEELQKIVDEYREKEIHISDEEAEQILWLCNRKMDICKIEDREELLSFDTKSYFSHILISHLIESFIYKIFLKVLKKKGRLSR